MSKKLLPFAAFIALMVSSAMSQEILSAEKFLDGVSAQFGQVADYTANVTLSTGKNTPQQGRLSYKSPVFLRIDFDVPKGQVLVITGEKLVIYVPDLEKVLEQTYRSRPPSSASLLDMTSKQGLTLLRANYGVAYYGTPDSVPLDDGSREMVVKLKLTPKSSGTAFSEIVVSIGKDNMIRRMDGLYSSGEHMVMDLTNVKINQNIPDSRFKYDPPAYASVMPDFLFDSGG